MGRIRTVKPEFFQHEGLYDLEQQLIESNPAHAGDTDDPRNLRYSGSLRLAFAALWCQADREGRFRWNPRRLKLHCMPYDEVDFEVVMEWLTKGGYILPYEVDGKQYGWIPSFRDHQHINNREAESNLPSPQLANPDLFTGQGPQAPADWKAPDRVRGQAMTIEHAGRRWFVANAESAPFLDPPKIMHTNQSDTVWLVPAELIEQWTKAYPAVDVDAELEKAAAWLLTNKTNRKTPRGMSTFLNRWLGNTQDKGGGAGRPKGEVKQL